MYGLMQREHGIVSPRRDFLRRKRQALLDSGKVSRQTEIALDSFPS